MSGLNLFLWISGEAFACIIAVLLWPVHSTPEIPRTSLHTKKSLRDSKRWQISPCALTEHHAIKAYLGSGGMGPCILNLGTRWIWVVSFTPRPLYSQGKSQWYPLHRRLGWPQSRPGRDEEKNSQPVPGLEPPIIQPVAQCYTIELSRHHSKRWPYRFIWGQERRT
jgi:hypothetical protein